MKSVALDSRNLMGSDVVLPPLLLLLLLLVAPLVARARARGVARFVRQKEAWLTLDRRRLKVKDRDD